ncbi:Transcriptional regulatory protein KdpE [bacterium HR28]|uniref:Response regulator transcription factor n=1 Tax=Thermomicrobium roseum TaxID=500 RepID=A0A7C1X5T5_THERO|nr:Transcriptional regulatory protein KdpE [bacterium HR28]
MGKRLVLVVDDDPSIQRLLRAALTLRGYSVVVAGTAKGALEALDRHEPDLVLLDIILPDRSGFEVLQDIRARSTIPIILISARVAPEDRVLGLELGADDYVTKPFHLDELLARIAAVLRRACRNTPQQTVLHYDHVTIDLQNRRVYVDGQEVRLSRTEWALLEQLARNPGRVMRHAELLSHVWGPEFVRETYYLRTWVSRLRSKLRDEEPHRVIVTRPGLGYQLAEPPAVSA